MAWSTRCARVRRHPHARFLDHAERLVVGKHHVLDGIDARLQRHALALRREAVHRALLVEGVRLVDDGVALLLRHVADIGFFLVGAAAAGDAALDPVSAIQEILARELAQLPRPVGGLEAEAERRARLDQRKMRAGDNGEGRNLHARPLHDPGIDGIADGAGLPHQQPVLRIHAEIAHRGEAHIEDELSVEQPVHLLQFGRDLPHGDAVVVEGQAVEHQRVEVDVHHARHQRALAAIDHLGAGRNLDGRLGTDLFDALALEHDHRVGDRIGAGAVDHARGGDVLDRVVFRRGFTGCCHCSSRSLMDSSG